MISLQPLLLALRKQPAGWSGGHWFRTVGGLVEFTNLAASLSVPAPVAFVVRGSESAENDGERSMLVTVSFDVVMVVANQRIGSAGDSDDALLVYREAVRGLLQGVRFGSPTSVGEVKFTGGSAVDYNTVNLIWRDSYSFLAQKNNYLPDPPNFERLTKN